MCKQNNESELNQTEIPIQSNVSCEFDSNEMNQICIDSLILLQWIVFIHNIL